MHYTPGDIDILVRTVAGEARGESITGKRAVVHVIRNRARSKRFKEHTLAQVCLKYKQFSCWNEDDRNFKYIVDLLPTSKVYRDCLTAVSMALEEEDFTNGALHYHTKTVQPVWSKGHRPCYTEGSHVFFNDVA